MEIKKITDPAFRKYGKILTGSIYGARRRDAEDAVSGQRDL